MNSRSGNFWKYSNSYFYPLDHYYSTLEDKYSDPHFFSNLIQKHDFKVYNTPVELSFKSRLPFGSGLKSIVDELGKPQIIYEKEDIPGYLILLYRTFIAGEKAKIELHFYNEKLCIYSYIFSYLSQLRKSELLEILSLKYLDDRTLDISSFKVNDRHKNILLVEDSVDLAIWYFSGDTQFSKLIKTFQDNFEKEKRSQIKRKKQEFFRLL